MPETADTYFDTIVVDKEDQPIALMQVKGIPMANGWASHLPKQLQAVGMHVPFVILVDPNWIDVYQWDGSTLTGPVAHLAAADVLRPYEPEYGNFRIYYEYLQTLVEAWLRDLAYHWKLESPPRSDELRRVGLLSRLEGGTTHSLGRQVSWG
jgi:hypothetical protein